MTRKDTILIAVVINAGLLAILFTTAVIYDTDSSNEQIEFTAPLVDNKTPPADPSPLIIASSSTGDEVDNVLKYYTSPAPEPILVQTQSEVYTAESINIPSPSADEEEGTESEESSSQERLVEVKVKRGDVLEKIAKTHKTTVKAIKQANHLENERLSIGQVLKIPVKQKSSAPSQVAVAEPKGEDKPEVKKEAKGDEPVYYIVKSGDNPWKIAKQFGVKYDEILRLNHLDEEKARNLKIGDRIRVK